MTQIGSIVALKSGGLAQVVASIGDGPTASLYVDSGRYVGEPSAMQIVKAQDLAHGTWNEVRLSTIKVGEDGALQSATFSKVK